MTDLFTPLQAGALELNNRILMAPLTRCRADEGHIPSEIMATHYAQRASSGLLIAEATMVMEGNSAFWKEPGIYNSAQVAAWKRVTDDVHQAGGKIVLQLWHGGRACHPDLNDGAVPVAPSAIAISNEMVYTPKGKQHYTLPRALETSEIATVVEGFANAARLAQQAGFDGVEVHGANGYLIDQFLRTGSNQRDDAYGGSLENRARFLFEVLDAVCAVWGADRVGLRISPLNSFNDMQDEDPIKLASYLAQRLNGYGLAYLHLMRADGYAKQQGDLLTPVRQHYQGVLVANMGYTPEEAQQAVQSGAVDAVAFGTAYIANPDLVERIRQGAALNVADPNTFYSQGEAGYNDYPRL
ncbi:MAG: alkene reductase [Gammaproteobacteria bacterium]|nr:alkene reductase [Gammaproteobacteria bacterium]